MKTVLPIFIQIVMLKMHFLRQNIAEVKNSIFWSKNTILSWFFKILAIPVDVKSSGGHDGVLRFCHLASFLDFSLIAEVNNSYLRFSKNRISIWVRKKIIVPFIVRINSTGRNVLTFRIWPSFMWFIAKIQPCGSQKFIWSMRWIWDLSSVYFL